MTVYIEARTEPYNRYREDYAQVSRLGERGSFAVRRPVRGIQLKEETYAAIRIMGPNGRFLPVIDAAGETYNENTGQQTTTYWTNFFVTKVQEERHEKTQIVTTFGEEYIFLFGEAPRMLKVEGLLLNTWDFNWEAEFWENYDLYFRGTRLAELGARLYLIYDDVIAEGLVMGASAVKSNDIHVVPFGFQMYLTGYTNISRIGAPDFPISSGVSADYTALSAYDQALRTMHLTQNLVQTQMTRAIQTTGEYALLTDALRQGVISGGDPSLAGFMSRARDAMSMFGSMIPGFGGRTTPIRSRFRDNEDEFVGGGAESKMFGDGYDEDQSWLDMDHMVDEVMSRTVSLLDATRFDGCGNTAFWDMMGRPGRATREIRERGGYRQRSDSRSVIQTAVDSARTDSGSVIQTAVASVQSSSQPPLTLRTVPYGTCLVPGGELI
jgi:hypothetical protein